MNVTKVLTKEYEEKDAWSSGENEPKQTQSNPIQSQTKPISGAKNDRGGD